MLSEFTEWSRGDASDMDGQVDRPSERERTSQTPDNASDSNGFGRLSSLNKQLQSIELIAQHAFNSWRDLLESSVDEPADAIRELNAGVVSVACQFPRKAAGKTRRLEWTERAGEPHELRRSHVNNPEMFDSAAVRQLLAKASSWPRIKRKILRIV
jgi:hypothetical protein